MLRCPASGRREEVGRLCLPLAGAGVRTRGAPGPLEALFGGGAPRSVAPVLAKILLVIHDCGVCGA
jgi:hypothetical protein